MLLAPPPRRPQVPWLPRLLAPTLGLWLPHARARWLGQLAAAAPDPDRSRALAADELTAWVDRREATALQRTRTRRELADRAAVDTLTRQAARQRETVEALRAQVPPHERQAAAGVGPLVVLAGAMLGDGWLLLEALGQLSLDDGVGLLVVAVIGAIAALALPLWVGAASLRWAQRRDPRAHPILQGLAVLATLALAGGMLGVRWMAARQSPDGPEAALPLVALAGGLQAVFIVGAFLHGRQHAALAPTLATAEAGLRKTEAALDRGQMRLTARDEQRRLQHAAWGALRRELLSRLDGAMAEREPAIRSGPGRAARVGAAAVLLAAALLASGCGDRARPAPRLLVVWVDVSRSLPEPARLRETYARAVAQAAPGDRLLVAPLGAATQARFRPALDTVVPTPPTRYGVYVPTARSRRADAERRAAIVTRALALWDSLQAPERREGGTRIVEALRQTATLREAYGGGPVEALLLTDGQETGEPALLTAPRPARLGAARGAGGGDVPDLTGVTLWMVGLRGPSPAAHRALVAAWDRVLRATGATVKAGRVGPSSFDTPFAAAPPAQAGVPGRIQ